MRTITVWGILLLFAYQNHLTDGLRCYTCTYVVGIERSCITDPREQQVTNCNKKYCIIQRQEVTGTGTVKSFLRGCEDKPLYLNTVEEDSESKTYYRSCTTDYCNDGDGIRVSQSNVVDEVQSNLLVPGKSKGYRTNNLIYLTLFGIISIYFL